MGEAVTKLKQGRPTGHTEELAIEICNRLSVGETVRSICKDEHTPSESTVRRWIMSGCTHLAKENEVFWMCHGKMYKVAEDGSVKQL